MSWQADWGDHEGYVANVLIDGREPGSSTSAGVIVHPPTDADVEAGYEIRRYPESDHIEVVIPWDQVATWRIACTCGWTGSEMPAYADDTYGFRDCPQDLQDDVFYPQWRAHVAPFEALGELGDLAGQASAIERQLANKVQLARVAGASWSQIGREVGLTKQGAQQRWATPASTGSTSPGPGGGLDPVRRPRVSRPDCSTPEQMF